MIAADIVTILIPLWIVLGLLALLLLFGLVGRIQNGRFIKPLVMLLMKVPLFKRWIEKGSRVALERQNPELASAMRKLEPHQKHLHDPVRAQKAMSQLTKQERAALLAIQDQQGSMPEEAQNRQMRRALEKQRKRTR
ncbi:MAG TPA: hypothetical protein VIE38_13880 [Gaiellaceae bacterium]